MTAGRTRLWPSVSLRTRGSASLLLDLHLILRTRILDSVDALLGGSASRSDRCRLVVEHATGVRSKELVHRDGNPVGLFSFLSDPAKKRILNRGGRALHHGNE